MKSGVQIQRAQPVVGFTLVELLVVIALIVILAALLLPVLSRTKARASSAACKNHLHQIGIGLNLYVDESYHYPLYNTLVDPSDPGQKLLKSWESDLLPYTGDSKWLFHDPAWRWTGLNPALDLDIWEEAGVDGIGRNWCYGYNASGTGFDPQTAASALGLGGLAINRAVPGSLVRAPSDMLAIGDAIWYWGLINSGFGYPGTAWTPHSPWGDKRFRDRNAVFCDGHVESSDHRLIVVDGGVFPDTFMPDATHAKRWNNDNEPHPETWR